VIEHPHTEQTRPPRLATAVRCISPLDVIFEHARCRSADPIKRQAELSLTDSRFDPS